MTATVSGKKTGKIFSSFYWSIKFVYILCWRTFPLFGVPKQRSHFVCLIYLHIDILSKYCEIDAASIFRVISRNVLFLSHPFFIASIRCTPLNHSRQPKLNSFDCTMLPFSQCFQQCFLFVFLSFIKCKSFADMSVEWIKGFDVPFTCTRKRKKGKINRSHDVEKKWKFSSTEKKRTMEKE